ncbi:hypothetical protein A6A04_19120 [Paramagnetospirillum marisnigri]|uniref:ABC-type transport auxiliary lipoprotein component domain-containing protein n=2 Tax=Paramagnetospirillum marisnigri TaxID=1285242 RepID=A0A178MM46_9PROT|nr:hypothetical protein A6A04_19120 [Paramagnetospirillum marisnigri]
MAVARAESSQTTIELKTVSLPDYLDSTDILRRVGPNEVAPSPTGRWGERLSLGVTAALASALSRRRPDLAVVTVPPPRPGQRIVVDIQALDTDAAGQCRMEARWRIAGPDARGPSTSGHGIFADGADAPDDAALAAALTRVIDQLAEGIVATLEHE